MRAIDREAKRAERARLTSEKAALKQAMFEAAADAARQYDLLIQSLTCSHRIQSRRIDWLTTATEPLPAPPERYSVAEDKAAAALSSYRPSWFAKTFGFEKGQRAKLSGAIDAGRRADEDDFSARVSASEKRKLEIEFAQRLVALDHGAVAQAVNERTSLGDLPFCIEGLDLLFTESQRIIAVVDGLDLEDMPEESITLLQSGKASMKGLSKSKVLELHRENICSSALRVAMELLQTLPVEEVEIVMHSDILDRGSGHIRGKPVLYLRVAAQALSTVNLDRAEASPLVDRLGGHLDWSSREGLREINLAPFNIPTQLVKED
jgi:hypothetical protein